MKFINMRNRPLEFPVKCGKKIVIPAGATDVKIAFRASHLKRYDPETGGYIPLNIYIYKGQYYHA